MENSPARAKRLKKEGNWQPFRDCLEDFVAQGMIRKDAYKAACEKFPPPDDWEPESQDEGVDNISDPRAHYRLVSVFGQANPVRDMEWIYQTLGVSKIKKRDAPCSGAYEARRLVVKNDEAKAAFLDVYWKQFAPNKAEVDREQAWANDDRELIELHERYRKQLAGQSGQ